jgi:hypothetical protein
MKRFKLFALMFGLVSVLALAGCNGGEAGPALFSTGEEDVEEVVVEGEEGDVTADEFGFLVEGTLCVKQLHSGCVPSDYDVFESSVIGIHFNVPTDWVNAEASETTVTFVAPAEEVEEGEEVVEDVTRLYAFRSVANSISELQETVNQTITDAGTGAMGPYDVTWEIYEGEINEQPVKAEWVTLTNDPFNPWINFVFLLVTEPENFLEDQAVIKAAASSVLSQTPSLQE